MPDTPNAQTELGPVAPAAPQQPAPVATPATNDAQEERHSLLPENDRLLHLERQVAALRTELLGVAHEVHGIRKTLRWQLFVTVATRVFVVAAALALAGFAADWLMGWLQATGLLPLLQQVVGLQQGALGDTQHLQQLLQGMQGTQQ